jgi:hypothetical protein
LSGNGNKQGKAAVDITNNGWEYVVVNVFAINDKVTREITLAANNIYTMRFAK